MSHTLEIILYRSISLEHPRWSREQVVQAARDAAEGRGPYAMLLADLQAAADE
jgi:hypothetical protein